MVLSLVASNRRCQKSNAQNKTEWLTFFVTVVVDVVDVVVALNASVDVGKFTSNIAELVVVLVVLVAAEEAGRVDADDEVGAVNELNSSDVNGADDTASDALLGGAVVVPLAVGGCGVSSASDAELGTVALSSIAVASPSPSFVDNVAASTIDVVAVAFVVVSVFATSIVGSLLLLSLSL